jgi:ABC-type transporter Mla subunit MlaD
MADSPGPLTPDWPGNGPALPYEPIPSPPPAGLRVLIRRIGSAGADLDSVANALGRQAAELSGYWQSRPSSGRAAARLSAIATLARSFSTEADAVVAGLTRYANRLETARPSALAADQRILATTPRCAPVDRASTTDSPLPSRRSTPTGPRWTRTADGWAKPCGRSVPASVPGR